GDRNAEALTADIAAIQAVIAQVLGRIHELDPILGEAIEGGFKDAASEIRVLGARARKGTGANQFVRAIATIESLQAAALDRSRLRPRATNDNGYRSPASSRPSCTPSWNATAREPGQPGDDPAREHFARLGPCPPAAFRRHGPSSRTRNLSWC